MAKYLKKRKISLRDIIFKSPKTNREEPAVSGERFGTNWVAVHEDHCDDENVPLKRNTRVEESANTNRRLCNASRRSHSDNDKRSDSDEQEDKAEQLGHQLDDEHENHYIMTRFFDSLKLSASEAKSPTCLGLPVDVRSSRSLSTMGKSDREEESLPQISKSISCGNICPNRIPGTPCSSVCSTPRARRQRRSHSPVEQSCSTKIGSEGEMIDIVTTIKLDSMASSQTSMDQSRILPRMQEGRLSLDGDVNPSPKVAVCRMRPPSSLNVSPDRSSSISSHPSVSVSPVPTQQEASYPHHIIANNHEKKMLPQRVRSAILPSLKSSASNPTLHHRQYHLNDEVDQVVIPGDGTTLGVTKILSPTLTRSNPNLYITHGPDLPRAASANAPSSSSLSPRFQIQPSTMRPTPPSSPCPSSRRLRRPPMVRVSGVRSAEYFDDISDVAHVTHQ